MRIARALTQDQAKTSDFDGVVDTDRNGVPDKASVQKGSIGRFKIRQDHPSAIIMADDCVPTGYITRRIGQDDIIVVRPANSNDWLFDRKHPSRSVGDKNLERTGLHTAVTGILTSIPEEAMHRQWVVRQRVVCPAGIRFVKR